MPALSSLKLTTAQKPNQIPVVQQRRNKLVKRLWEQAELAKAFQAGTQFQPVKFRTHVDKVTGARKQIEVTKRVKPWWFVTDNGKLALSIRFGPKVLELAKGKFAIEVAAESELVSVLELVKAATLAGELDSAIDSAVGKLREGFNR